MADAGIVQLTRRDVEIAIGMGTGIIEGMVKAFEAVPERTFTGEEVAEMLRKASDESEPLMRARLEEMVR